MQETPENIEPRSYADNPSNPRSRYLRRNPDATRPERYSVAPRTTSGTYQPTPRTAEMCERADRLSARHHAAKARKAEGTATASSAKSADSRAANRAAGRAASPNSPKPAASQSASSYAHLGIQLTSSQRPVKPPAQRGARGRRPRPGRPAASPRRQLPRAAVFAALIVACVGAVAYNTVISPIKFDITLNGTEVTVARGTTIDGLIEQNLARPTAGDFVAVDGSVLQEGGGKAYAATINAQPTDDGTTRVRKHDEVTIENGPDVMEDYDAETIEADFSAKVEEGAGAIHSYVAGAKGVIERRTGKTSGITHDEEISPIVDNGYVKLNADTNGAKVIALTFDDGPWPETTAQVLDILDEYGAKATFFTVGNLISGQQDVIKRMHDAGHQICTHTWDHADGSGQGVNLEYMSSDEQVAEVTRGYEAIEAATGAKASHVIRAPGGNFSGSIIWTLEEYVTAEIGWNVDTEDWRRPGADAIAERIKSATAGDVVLMHDGGGDRSQTVEALRIALPYLIEQGYTFVTIDELLAYTDPASLLAREAAAADAGTDDATTA